MPNVWTQYSLCCATDRRVFLLFLSKSVTQGTRSSSRILFTGVASCRCELLVEVCSMIDGEKIKFSLKIILITNVETKPSMPSFILSYTHCYAVWFGLFGITIECSWMRRCHHISGWCIDCSEFRSLAYWSRCPLTAIAGLDLIRLLWISPGVISNLSGIRPSYLAWPSCLDVPWPTCQCACLASLERGNRSEIAIDRERLVAILST